MTHVRRSKSQPPSQSPFVTQPILQGSAHVRYVSHESKQQTKWELRWMVLYCDRIEFYVSKEMKQRKDRIRFNRVISLIESETEENCLELFSQKGRYYLQPETKVHKWISLVRALLTSAGEQDVFRVDRHHNQQQQHQVQSSSGTTHLLQQHHVPRNSRFDESDFRDLPLGNEEDEQREEAVRRSSSDSSAFDAIKIDRPQLIRTAPVEFQKLGSIIQVRAQVPIPKTLLPRRESNPAAFSKPDHVAPAKSVPTSPTKAVQSSSRCMRPNLQRTRVAEFHKNKNTIELRYHTGVRKANISEPKPAEPRKRKRTVSNPERSLSSKSFSDNSRNNHGSRDYESDGSVVDQDSDNSQVSDEYDFHQTSMSDSELVGEAEDSSDGSLFTVGNDDSTPERERILNDAHQQFINHVRGRRPLNYRGASPERPVSKSNSNIRNSAGNTSQNIQQSYKQHHRDELEQEESSTPEDANHSSSEEKFRPNNTIHNSLIISGSKQSMSDTESNFDILGQSRPLLTRAPPVEFRKLDHVRIAMASLGHARLRDASTFKKPGNSPPHPRRRPNLYRTKAAEFQKVNEHRIRTVYQPTSLVLPHLSLLSASHPTIPVTTPLPSQSHTRVPSVDQIALRQSRASSLHEPDSRNFPPQAPNPSPQVAKQVPRRTYLLRRASSHPELSIQSRQRINLHALERANESRVGQRGGECSGSGTHTDVYKRGKPALTRTRNERDLGNTARNTTKHQLNPREDRRNSDLSPPKVRRLEKTRAMEFHRPNNSTQVPPNVRSRSQSPSPAPLGTSSPPTTCKSSTTASSIRCPSQNFTEVPKHSSPTTHSLPPLSSTHPVSAKKRSPTSVYVPSHTSSNTTQTTISSHPVQVSTHVTTHSTILSTPHTGHSPTHGPSRTLQSSPPSLSSSLLPPKSSSAPTLLISTLFDLDDHVISGETSDTDEMDTDTDNDVHLTNTAQPRATPPSTSTTAPPPERRLLRRASSYPELSIKREKPVLMRTRNVDFRKLENAHCVDIHQRTASQIIEMRSRAQVLSTLVNNNGLTRNRRQGRAVKLARPPLLSSSPAKFHKRKGSIEIVFRPTAIPTLRRKSSF